MTMRSRLRLQCTRTKREKFADSPPQAPSQAPGPTTPGYGSPPPSWPSSTAREWTPEQLSSSRTETLPKNEKLENEETMENKNHLPEYKHRDQPEGEAVCRRPRPNS